MRPTWITHGVQASGSQGEAANLFAPLAGNTCSCQLRAAWGAQDLVQDRPRVSKSYLCWQITVVFTTSTQEPCVRGRVDCVSHRMPQHLATSAVFFSLHVVLPGFLLAS